MLPTKKLECLPPARLNSLFWQEENSPRQSLECNFSDFLRPYIIHGWKDLEVKNTSLQSKNANFGIGAENFVISFATFQTFLGHLTLIYYHCFSSRKLLITI
jgi:hypothetical protein